MDQIIYEKNYSDDVLEIQISGSRTEGTFESSDLWSTPTPILVPKLL